MSELRTAFHHQLHDIEDQIIKFFGYVAEDLMRATDALLSNDAGPLELVFQRETAIDGVYPHIEELVESELLLQNPVASEFRLLISIMRVVPELERAHDLVQHIAEHASHMLGEELSPRSRGLVQRMGDSAAAMWRQTAEAWTERDSQAPLALDERDDDLDSLHAALMAELASGTMSLPVAMDMALVARYYERLGDHAVNIARRVAYLAGASRSQGVQA
jgi:phosphate transport system protein